MCSLQKDSGLQPDCGIMEEPIKTINDKQGFSSRNGEGRWYLESTPQQCSQEWLKVLKSRHCIRANTLSVNDWVNYWKWYGAITWECTNDSIQWLIFQVSRFPNVVMLSGHHAKFGDISCHHDLWVMVQSSKATRLHNVDDGGEKEECVGIQWP